MASRDFKAPPLLSRCSSYECWLKEIEIWQAFTTLTASKQGPAIFLTLEGRAREAVLELEVKAISAETGVKAITDKLDSLYLKDKVQSAYEAYDSFEKFKRPEDMSISQYLNEFERLMVKTKSYGTSMSSDILAYRLLKSANLSETHEQLARATISELKYENMKTQLRKIFGDSNNITDCGDLVKVKVENTHDSFLQEDVYYGRAGSYNFKSGYSGLSKQKTRGYNQNPKFLPKKSFERGKNVSGRGRNPPNSKGDITRCTICESINHWMSNCPDKVYFEQDDEDVEDNVTLYQSNLITDEHMRTFVSESFNCAILDSGATSTVAGKTWIDCYLDGLTSEE